jgi:hypothetical protein
MATPRYRQITRTFSQESSPERPTHPVRELADYLLPSETYQSLNADITYLTSLKAAHEAAADSIVQNTSEGEYLVFLNFAFQNCTNNCKILSARLLPRYYNSSELPSTIGQFLKAEGTTFSVLTETKEGIDKSHPLVSILAPFDKASIRVIPSEASSLVRVNFTMFDNAFYHLVPDKSLPEGYVRFGDSVGSLKLKGIFDTLSKLHPSNNLLDQFR